MKSFFLKLAAVIALFGGIARASAQTAGKALRIDYPSNHTSTSICLGGIITSPGMKSETIGFNNEIHRVGMDTSFSEILNTTAAGVSLVLDLDIRMSVRDNKDRNGNLVLVILNLIDATNGATLESITNVFATLKGDQADTTITRRINVDLSRYNGREVAVMMRSMAAGPTPILTFVDYAPDAAVRKPEQIH